MLFNSLEFALFLIIVFSVYWSLGLRGQNIFILAASYFFYAWWDWRFVSLLLFSSTANFFFGIGMNRASDQVSRKMWLTLSVVTNLSVLAFFKYFNFFLDTVVDVFSLVGLSVNFAPLAIILPLGISFFTFQVMSYTIDLYQNKIKVCRDPIQFFTYVTYFPQLVAGPIERAGRLLVQFGRERRFSRKEAVIGCRMILWGAFKKIVLADNLAGVVDAAYQNAEAASGGQFVVATILFSFQIYFDFSGYSDIAIGCSRLFGVDIMKNFNCPYFAKNIQEFWRRWHISLTSWLRDYVYIPLGGNRRGFRRQLVNIVIVFMVTGLWHGADWTFVAWGGFHGLLLVIYLWLRKIGWLSVLPVRLGRLAPFFSIMITYSLVCLAWILFRAESINDCFVILGKIGHDLVHVSYSFDLGVGKNILVLLLVTIGIEWLGRNRDHPLLLLENWFRPLRWMTYYVLIGLIYFYGKFEHDAFVYFQF